MISAGQVDTDFFISKNELEAAARLGDVYRIYRASLNERST
jgi:hypothetical protein